MYICIYICIYFCLYIIYIYIYELRPSYCKGLEIWQNIVVSIRFSQKLTGFATIVGYLVGAAWTTRMCWTSYIIEGSLNSKLPTIWRVEKQMKSREMK